jgi:hypothetical protein
MGKGKTPAHESSYTHRDRDRHGAERDEWRRSRPCTDTVVSGSGASNRALRRAKREKEQKTRRRRQARRDGKRERTPGSINRLFIRAYSRSGLLHRLLRRSTAAHFVPTSLSCPDSVPRWCLVARKRPLLHSARRHVGVATSRIPPVPVSSPVLSPLRPRTVQ